MFAVHISEKLRSKDTDTVMTQVEHSTREQPLKTDLPDAATDAIVEAMGSHENGDAAPVRRGGQGNIPWAVVRDAEEARRAESVSGSESEVAVEHILSTHRYSLKRSKEHSPAL